MTEAKGYWKWLIGGLAKFGLAFLRLVPKVIFEVIPGIFKAGFDFLKYIVSGPEIWENIFCFTTAVLIISLIGYSMIALNGLMPIEALKYWYSGMLSLFLISTYAYWRDKP